MSVESIHGSSSNPMNKEKSLSKALELAFEKPFVKGLLCADSNGLLIAAKGDIDGNTAGRYCNISHLALSLANTHQHDSTTAPTVTIETMNNEQIVVKDYDSMTIVLKYSGAPSSNGSGTSTNE